MKNFKTFSSAIAMLICFMTMAQKQTVYGVVSDSLGVLPNVIVKVKGQQTQTVTNAAGFYKIKVKKGRVLQVCKHDYAMQEIKVTKSKKADIFLIREKNVFDVLTIQIKQKETKDTLMIKTEVIKPLTKRERKLINTTDCLQIIDRS
uniref:carboxypeptidase-like regulatory domain-containing protein n=1 Tax=Flavobacterium sp. TaxID=239 RepID=UPI00404966D3